jgi:Mor family transcriptional regulator
MTMTTSAIPTLRNHDILTSLLKGQRLTAVARDYGVSKQRIHQIVHNFKNTSKDSPEYQQYQNYVTMTFARFVRGE